MLFCALWKTNRTEVYFPTSFAHAACAVALPEMVPYT